MGHGRAKPLSSASWCSCASVSALTCATEVGTAAVLRLSPRRRMAVSRSASRTVVLRAIVSSKPTSSSSDDPVPCSPPVGGVCTPAAARAARALCDLPANHCPRPPAPTSGRGPSNHSSYPSSPGVGKLFWGGVSGAAESITKLLWRRSDEEISRNLRLFSSGEGLTRSADKNRLTKHHIPLPPLRPISPHAGWPSSQSRAARPVPRPPP